MCFIHLGPEHPTAAVFACSLLQEAMSGVAVSSSLRRKKINKKLEVPWYILDATRDFLKKISFASKCTKINLHVFQTATDAMACLCKIVKCTKIKCIPNLPLFLLLTAGMV